MRKITVKYVPSEYVAFWEVTSITVPPYYNTKWFKR